MYLFGAGVLSTNQYVSVSPCIRPSEPAFFVWTLPIKRDFFSFLLFKQMLLNFFPSSTLLLRAPYSCFKIKFVIAEHTDYIL
jgi:hypothetical protein